MKLGYPHPDYLRRAIDSRQIAEWIAYFKIEPFGQLHQEYLFGQICACIVNSNPFRKEGSLAVLTTDFMPSYEEPPESWHTIRDNLRMWKELSDDGSSG